MRTTCSKTGNPVPIVSQSMYHQRQPYYFSDEFKIIWERPTSLKSLALGERDGSPGPSKKKPDRQKKKKNPNSKQITEKKKL